MNDIEFSVKPFDAEEFAKLLMQPNVTIGYGGFEAPELEDLNCEKQKPAHQHKKRKKRNKK